MATATCTAFRGVVESTGERVGQRVLLERVGFLARLSRTLTGPLVVSRWDEVCLDVLAAGVNERGEDLPSKGRMALRRLHWPQTVTPPAGVYVPDRVRRGAEEYAARTLRLALHRRGIVTAIPATWPADPSRRTEAEWTALRKLLPAGVSGAEIRNRTRQVRGFVSKHGKLPAGLCVLEGPPQVAPQVLLAAMDRQQVTLARVDETTARLRVKLPLRAAPWSPTGGPSSSTPPRFLRSGRGRVLHAMESPQPAQYAHLPAALGQPVGGGVVGEGVQAAGAPFGGAPGREPQTATPRPKSLETTGTHRVLETLWLTKLSHRRPR
ncbi:hypothetical protein ACIRRI_38405 [Streptomyces mirabilis]|uniref:hypothetical protein n=1 Tax=Streptomyces mirabilis TaxID=68239 RepID=UPI00381B57C7